MISLNRHELYFSASLNLVLAMGLLVILSEFSSVHASAPYLAYAGEYTYTPLLGQSPYGKLNFFEIF